MEDKIKKGANETAAVNEAVKPTPRQSFVQSVKFLFLSISAGIIQIVVFTLINELARFSYLIPGLEKIDDYEYGFPYLIALLLSVLYNFTLNRRFTFKSAANVTSAMLKVLAFYCVFTPVTTIAGEWVTRMGVNEYIVLGVTMVLNFVTEFLFCSLVVYRNNMYTNDLGKAELARMEQKKESEANRAENAEEAAPDGEVNNPEAAE